MVANSSCVERGTAFLCSDYQPQAVSETLSYGFAMTTDWSRCCKCYELKWTGGPASGKIVQVQVIDIVKGSDAEDNVTFTLLVPGSDLGAPSPGCKSQYRNGWYAPPFLSDVSTGSNDAGDGVIGRRAAAVRKVLRTARDCSPVCRVVVPGGSTGHVVT